MLSMPFAKKLTKIMNKSTIGLVFSKISITFAHVY